MEQILIAIQDRLATQVGGLKYIDKDWKQLQMEHPPVKFPCALIDVENIHYTTVKENTQRAEAEMSVTVANLRLTRSSAQAPNRLMAHETLRLMSEIHQALNGFDGNGQFRPLTRTALRKLYGDTDAEVYALTYRTVFTD